VSADKYNEAYPAQAEKLCRLMGATDEQLGEFFGVHRNTILNWRNEHAEFREACRVGKMIADLQVVEGLHKRACGYDYDGKHYPPDPTSGIWWTKNRLGWRDKPEGEAPDAASEADALRDALREMDEADGE
jgi:hypothetical protein